MKIGARLAASFAAVLALLVVVGLVVNVQMARMNDNTQFIVKNRLALQNLAREGQAGTYFTALYLYRAIAEASPQALDEDLEKVEKQAKRNGQIYQELQSMLTEHAEALSVMGKLISVRKAYNVALKPAHVLMAKHDVEGAKAALLAATPLQVQLLQAQADVINYERVEMEKSVAQSEQAYWTARMVLWSVIAAAFIVAGTLGWLLVRSVVGPMQKVVDGAKALAQGDLTYRIDVARKDEVGVLANVVNQAIGQTAGVVRDVKRATDSIASATQQVAGGNDDLSQRTQEQAASLEQTVASMEQLTVTVRQNEESAKQASSLAAAASETALQGGVEVNRVVASMQAISHSSAKVVDIIAVIEGIAFQTNILALNAAVEAARAGDQGRGFAVVAGEVRTLAQRSAAAAKEIKALIEASATHVHEGSDVVARAGGTMNDLVRAVRRVTEITNEISAASSEQATGIEQINKAVSQMDQVTQQNAALVEEASAAAQSLAQQAVGLRDAVKVFKLDDAGDSGSHHQAGRDEASRARPHSTTHRGAPKSTPGWTTF
ncbi:hypothetical protein PPGU19_070510 (plasmid) [Paraburkholderia sp. PGU19]|uniref:methyl-accepting chemotaxis protein n=1 Tax=Paraburkholderia sp. PGU19 TaxID=2735434 RepID=UPI0015DBC1AB|nr:methyl-accepting chemotaxis protein [Paraburkholderia sp. PGU19]BCG02483.1 hypothetical protein PPGU19_070510 [Paraburkholderia sp. PGU19]